jgi:chorismate mutase
MENKKEMKTWLTDFNLSHPFVIAGPCSAETEEQVLKIAHELKDSDVSFLEREFGNQDTSGGFEGVGEIGLKWLKKKKQRRDRIVNGTEVANATHDAFYDMMYCG